MTEIQFKIRRVKSGRLNDMSRSSNTVILAILLLLTVICVFPMLLIISVSFSEESEIRSLGYSILPRGFTFKAYQLLFADAVTVARSAWVSLRVTIIGSFLSLTIIALYAYPISRRDFRYKNLFSFLVFFTMLFNGGLVPWYVVYVNLLNLKNNILALIIPALFTPFYVLVMRSFYVTSIPDSLIESAKIDGANEIIVFLQIVLPLSLAGLATIGLFNVIAYWNDWYRALVFIPKKQVQPLQYLLYNMQNEIRVLKDMAQRGNLPLDEILNVPEETARMAMCVLVITPVVFAYPFFQKYFITGLTIGAVKG